MTNLHTALAAFQDAMPAVPKNRVARASDGYRYRYADLADVTNAARPVLAEHGLVFYTAPGIADNGAAYITGYLVHTESGEWAEADLPLHGRHPQELGSAITYARRYLLGCLTGLLTEEDDDGGSAAVAPAMASAAEVNDAASLDAALAAANTIAKLQAIYVDFALSAAPEYIRQRYADRVDAVKAAGFGGE